MFWTRCLGHLLQQKNPRFYAFNAVALEFLKNVLLVYGECARPNLREPLAFRASTILTHH